MSTSTSKAFAPSYFDEETLEQVCNRLQRVTRRRLRLPPSTDGKPVRSAAVLVPLCNRDGRASVLFTLRAASLKLHRSEVSFPGGMEDPEDEGSPVATARRETEEELGISASTIRVLGTYHQSLSKTKIPVTAVIGFLGDFNGPDITSLININKAEIESVFTLALGELLDPTKHEYRTYTAISGRFKSFTAGPHPVWGLTAFIMDEVLNELILSNDGTLATSKL